MKIISFKYNDETVLPSGVALCLGYFDGVHRGHQKLIEQAQKSNCPIAVLTLDKSPKAFLLGRKEISLTSLSDKAEYFEDLGVKYLFVLEFNEEVSKLSKDQFKELIIDRIKPCHIYVGQDYRFGFHREGTPEYLSQFYPLDIVDLFEEDNHKISSHEIALLISDGQIALANKLLGHPYRISGTVVSGFGNGRKMDFPTANVDLDYDYILPQEGVYICYAYIAGRKRAAITSVSRHPTINLLNKPIIESFILDFRESIYGRFISIEFLEYIRPIYKFESVEDLKKQIAQDEEKAKKYLQSKC